VNEKEEEDETLDEKDGYEEDVSQPYKSWYS
jgi:hypothetical protein